MGNSGAMKHFILTAVTPMVIFAVLVSCSKTDTTYTPTEHMGPSTYYVKDIGGSRPGLTIIDLKAYQQTTEYTCGPAAVVTLLKYYNRSGDEMEIARGMNTSTTTGTTPENMARWLVENGFDVEWGEHGSLELIRENLSKKIPTLIEWSDWGGHWVLAVGYDTRNTEIMTDDVIIFADPYDRHDDLKDGIDWFNAGRFYYMWYDARLFGTTMERIYITATVTKPSRATKPF
jgi:hypothetical protein